MEERRREALGAAACAVETVSTGSLGLDIALGMGGLPRGCVVEVFGPEGAGRTTLALQVVAEVQRSGGAAAFVDAERALDASYAQKLGVDIDDLVVSRPYSGEQALEIAEMLVRSKAIDMVVVDSVAALTPRAEMETAIGEVHSGFQARLMWRALRRLNRHIGRSKAIVLFINQIRLKIGISCSTEVTIGGEAFECFASVRLDTRCIGSVRKGDEVIGNMTRVRVVKNKLAPAMREAQFQILYGNGISREAEIIELAGSLGIISKSSAGYSYKGKCIGLCKNDARACLRVNTAIAREIEDQVRGRLLPVGRPPAPRWSTQAVAAMGGARDGARCGDAGCSAGSNECRTGRSHQGPT